MGTENSFSFERRSPSPERMRNQYDVVAANAFNAVFNDTDDLNHGLHEAAEE